MQIDLFRRGHLLSNSDGPGIHAIQGLPDQGMACMGHMDPDLMGPPMLDGTPAQGFRRDAVRILRQDLIESPCRFAVRVDLHMHSVRDPAQRRFYFPEFRASGEASPYFCQIDLLKAPLLPLAAQHGGRFRVLGKYNNSGSIPVQPAKQIEPAGNPLPSQISRRRVGQCIRVVAGRGMTDQAGPLVDRQDIGILI